MDGFGGSMTGMGMGMGMGFSSGNHTDFHGTLGNSLSHDRVTQETARAHAMTDQIPSVFTHYGHTVAGHDGPIDDLTQTPSTDMRQSRFMRGNTGSDHATGQDGRASYAATNHFHRYPSGDRQRKGIERSFSDLNCPDNYRRHRRDNAVDFANCCVIS